MPLRVDNKMRIIIFAILLVHVISLYHLSNSVSKTKLYSSTIYQIEPKQSSTNTVKPIMIHEETSIPLNIHQLSVSSNSKFVNSDSSLLSPYRTNLRLLTPKEELLIGKINLIYKKYDIIRNNLVTKLGRDPNYDEWASECGITREKLENYINIVSKSRNILVTHNMKLVDYFTKLIIKTSNQAKKLSYFELITEGIIGLTKAAESYDGRGKFSTYSQLYIKNAIYQAITKLQPGSIVTHRDVMYNNRAKKIRYRLRESLSRTPTDEEVAKELGVPVTYLRTIRERNNKKLISADHPFSVTTSKTHSDETSLQCYLDMDLTINDSGYGDTSVTSTHFLWNVNFKYALNCLNPDEKRLLGLRFGFLDGASRTIPRAAELMCISEEAARLMILRAFDKIKASPYACELLESGPPAATSNTLGNKISAKQY